MTLNEYTNKRLNTIIESFGINDDVDSAAENLILFIKQWLKTIDKSKNNSIRTDYTFIDKKVKVVIKYFVPDKNSPVITSPTAMWLEPFKSIEIIVNSVDGKIDYNDLYDSVQHELEHCYQNIKMGHGFGGQDVYNVARKYLYSPNEIDRCLAHIIYASVRNEQDAMINGLYAQIKQECTEKSIDDIIKDSEAYAWLQNLYKAINIFKQNKNNPVLHKAIEEYAKHNKHYDYTKFRKIANKGKKEFEWKLARLIKGAKERFIVEYNLRLPPILSKGEHKSSNWLYYII